MQIITTTQWHRLLYYKQPFVLALLIHLVFTIMLSRLTPVWREIETHKPADTMRPQLTVSIQNNRPKRPETEQIAPQPEPSEPEEVPQPVKDKPAVITQADNDSDIINKPVNEELRAQLLQQLVKSQLNSNTVQLGQFSNHALPTNWTRKAISYTPGIFKAAELPSRAIVLDQWKNADGSMQNKIKLPNGDVVCGNLGAHNPLDIYSMPIWMYQSC